MRVRWLLLLPLGLVLAAPGPKPVDDAQQALVDQSEKEFEAAKAEALRLQARADQATDELEGLRADHRAAAGQIEAAEARITLAAHRLNEAQIEARAARLALANAQRPIASLLAGVAVMGERPPLLALIDGGSIDRLVQTRVLLDSTLPVIRSHSRDFAARSADAQRALADARGAFAELKTSRTALERDRLRFARIEERLIERSARAGMAALEASDQVLAAGDASARARGDLRSGQAMKATAIALAAGAGIPPRPGAPDGSRFRTPFAYRLPANAAVMQGLGDVDRAGVRARGITLATARGALLEAPGGGTVAFAGPFRGFDGVLIIDHGGGWKTMIVNVASQIRRGQRVAIGQPVSRALGPISVELYRNGKPYSAALIAGSSAPLSKDREGG